MFQRAHGLDSEQLLCAKTEMDGHTPKGETDSVQVKLAP